VHLLEPYTRWLTLYDGDLDRWNPLAKQGRPEEGYHVLYDHRIHPEWDSLGSETLYVKVLYADYSLAFSVIELMGEWNDVLHNDIMWLKRELVDPLLKAGIRKFVLIGENVLHYFGEEDVYYEEWAEDLEDGWLVAMGFREHVCQDWDHMGLGRYLHYGSAWNDPAWRTRHPIQLYWMINAHFFPGLTAPDNLPSLNP
jgi:hypothetical protein